MADRITKTTTTSWFSRVGSAFAGVLVGLILIVGCVFGLAWNEGNAVKTARGLTEGADLVVEAPALPIDPANEQKLVHVTGPVVVRAPLEDTEFGVSASGVKLARKVEMYQWTETSQSESRTKLGGGEETVTTYSYAREWSPNAVDSSAFAEPGGHENPEMAVEAAEVYARDATLGAYRLNENVLGKIGGAQPLRLRAADLEAIEAAAGQGRQLSIAQNRIYIGENPSVPTIGDTRIGYDLTPASQISVVGRQNGDDVLAYRTRNGSEILLVADGDIPAGDMFQSAQDENNLIAWIIRVVGMVLLMVGFGLILAPLGVLADVLPLAGTIVRMGTGLIGFVLGMVVGTVTIALAWLAFRPITTLIILAIGGAVAFAVYRFGRRRDKSRQAAA